MWSYLANFLFVCAITTCLDGVPIPRIEREFNPYAETGKHDQGFWGSDHRARAGAYGVKQKKMEVNLLEVSADSSLSSNGVLRPFVAGKVGATVARTNFNIGMDGDNVTLESTFLSASGQVGAGYSGGGFMGRASLMDHTLHAGPVDVNFGIVADTGIYVDKGIEAKFLGIGGSIKSDGIQACFIFCVGINW